MNDSDFYYKVARNLFFVARSKTLAGPGYYVHFVKKVAKLAFNHPGIFVKRSFQAIFKTPRSFIDIFTRRYLLQDWTPQSVRLKRTNKEYYEWIEQVETPSLDIKQQKGEAGRMEKQPLVSLITPVFDPPLKVHEELIDSVLAQTYGNFELMLYNFGVDPEIKDLLDDYAEKDPRIKVKHNLKNEGISKNSNYCLKSVMGEFVGLLDHDDVLEPNALFECVKAINEHAADFVYSDKDMMSEQGRRFDPTFKPDWSPEMEITGNYLTHFNLMRTELVKSLGGWDPATDGAQDWDLFWRITEKTDKIVHVPKIVYHWRTVKGSTSNHIKAKPYVLDGQIRTAEKHLKHMGMDAKPYHDWTGQLYIDWTKKSRPAVFAVHLLYTTPREVRKLIKNIHRQKDFAPSSKIMLFYPAKSVDLKEKKQLKKIEDLAVHEYSVGDFVNVFTKKVLAENTDTIFYVSDSLRKIDKAIGKTPWLSQLQGWLSVPEIGMAGGLGHAPDGRVVDCGSFFDNKTKKFFKFYFGTGHRSGYIGHLQWTRNFVLPSERLFAFKADILKGLAGYPKLDLAQIRDDELPKLLAIENFSKGMRTVYDPSVTSVDRAPFHIMLPASKQLDKFLTGRGKKLVDSGDPYYSPNLCPGSGDPKLVKIGDESALVKSLQYELIAVDGILSN